MASIHDLDRLVRKGVRTKDRNDLGNVIGVNDTHIIVQGKEFLNFQHNLLIFIMEAKFF
ncbi:MAG: hypothetical protein ACRD8K_04220 [Nitrososphaeraceae archaeon]